MNTKKGGSLGPSERRWTAKRQKSKNNVIDVPALTLVAVCTCSCMQKGGEKGGGEGEKASAVPLLSWSVAAITPLSVAAYRKNTLKLSVHGQPLPITRIVQDDMAPSYQSGCSVSTWPKIENSQKPTRAFALRTTHIICNCTRPLRVSYPLPFFRQQLGNKQSGLLFLPSRLQPRSPTQPGTATFPSQQYTCCLFHISNSIFCSQIHQ